MLIVVVYYVKKAPRKCVSRLTALGSEIVVALLEAIRMYARVCNSGGGKIIYISTVISKEENEVCNTHSLEW